VVWAAFLLGIVVDEVEDADIVEKDVVRDREQTTIATLSRAVAPRYVGSSFCIPVHYMIVCWVRDSRKRKLRVGDINTFCKLCNSRLN
jgi:hypothetical protein